MLNEQAGHCIKLAHPPSVFILITILSSVCTSLDSHGRSSRQTVWPPIHHHSISLDVFESVTNGECRRAVYKVKLQLTASCVKDLTRHSRSSTIHRYVFLSLHCSRICFNLSRYCIYRMNFDSVDSGFNKNSSSFEGSRVIKIKSNNRFKK